MLILTVREDEEVFIGPDILVKIVGRAGRAFRLGIEAPREVKVARASFLKKKQGDEYTQAHDGPDRTELEPGSGNDL